MGPDEFEDAAAELARSGQTESRLPGQSPPLARRSESGPAPRHRRSPRGVDARRPSRCSASWIRYSRSQHRTGTRHGQCGRPGVPPSIRSARPAGSPLGSCRIGAGLSSQMAALRPLSSSQRSGASRDRRRTPEEPRETQRFGYSTRRTVGLPRRRIRRVGSHCGNLGPPALSSCATLEHYGPPLDADRTQHSAWRPGILFETPANLIG